MLVSVASPPVETWMPPPCQEKTKAFVPAGRWRKDLEKGTRRAHIFRGVRIHVGVDQRCRARAPDVKPPATLPSMSTHNVPVGRWMEVHGKFKMQTPTPSGCAHARQHSVNSAGRWNVTCVGSIWRKTHVGLPRHTANSEHTSGAMDESSGKVQDASTQK